MRRVGNSWCGTTPVYSVALAALLAWYPSSGVAQAKSPSATPDVSYQSEAVIVEQLETGFRYNMDGTDEKDIHERVNIQSEAGARQFSVLSFPYAAANETPRIQSLLVHHQDGTVTETPPADAMDMPAPVTQQAPLYSDLKLLQIPVRGLRNGDWIEYRVHVQGKNAESPDQFWKNFSFTKGVVVLAESLTLDVPAEKYVQVWSPNYKPVLKENAGRRVYVWSNSQLNPTSSGNKKEDSPGPETANKPDLGWTTFHTWQEVGEWYRALSAPRSVATDALRAQADEITHQAKSPDEQIQALYSFVATHIRFVGIDFGIGRYQPHAAAEVLANQYGDCKDKDTLLEALLHAKGFTSAPALIGVNLEVVPELPSPSFFNHVITTVNLASSRLWMDTSPGVAPFQVLLSPLRAKDALVIPLVGAATLERTPGQPPFPFMDRFEASATLKGDGELNGHVDINYRSDTEILVRLLAQNLAPAQWDQGTQYLANLLGFSGTTSHSAFGRFDDTSLPMHVSYDYTRKPFGDWDNFRIVPLFPVNALPATPEKQPSAEIDLGALRTEIAVSRISLPEGYGADLPDAIHVQTPFATFEKTYKLDKGELIAERKLVILQSKLPAESWVQYKKFSKDISLGEETWVQLTASNPSGKGTHPPKPGENDPLAGKLISDATVLERNNDWAGAIKKLDDAKEIQPKQPFLWSNYGYVAMRQNRADEAKEHFRHELALHPDEGEVVRLYGWFLHWHGGDEEALKVLNSFFQNDPSDSGIAVMLASIQSNSSLPDAIATLRRTIAATPSDHEVAKALCEYLVRSHQDAEAATLAKKLLIDAPDDPAFLTSSANVLAETNSDLPVAEQASRKAVQILERETTLAAINDADEQSFIRTATLIPDWGTLGFVLLRENKLDEARDYLEASWNNTPDPEIGLHYGQVQEALGDSKNALITYELAGDMRPVLPEIQQQIDASAARLRKSITPNVKVNSGNLFQERRTFRLQLKSARKSYSTATFRLELAAGETQGAMRVGGDSSLDNVESEIKHLPLPHLVPTHSNGRILRDAVLTCSPGQTECFFVLMPTGNIEAERIGN